MLHHTLSSKGQTIRDTALTPGFLDMFMSLSLLCFFIFRHFDWICCNRNRGCLYECVYVCVSVCGSSTAKTVVSILIKLCTKDLTDIYLCQFFQFLKIQIWWLHYGHFALFLWGTLTVAIFVRFSSNLNTRYKVVFHSLLLKISKIGRELLTL